MLASGDVASRMSTPRITPNDYHNPTNSTEALSTYDSQEANEFELLTCTYNSLATSNWIGLHGQTHSVPNGTGFGHGR